MVVKADNKRRVVLPGAAPGDCFDVQVSGSVFRLTLLKPVVEDAPLVKPVRTKEGFLMLPSKLDRKLVAAAIRADRDAQ
jgi:hypothetical protein